jgi:hypothetical protein
MSPDENRESKEQADEKGSPDVMPSSGRDHWTRDLSVDPRTCPQLRSVPVTRGFRRSVIQHAGLRF